MPRRGPRIAALLAVAAAAAGLGLLAPAVSAASGRLYEMQVVGGPRSVSLSPSALSVTLGDRVAFTNASSTIVEVRVGGYDVTLVPGQSADGGLGPSPYDAVAAGRQVVTATAQPSGARGSGSITASARTAGTPQPTAAAPADTGQPPRLAATAAPAPAAPTASPRRSRPPSPRPTGAAATGAAAGPRTSAPSTAPLALGAPPRGPLEQPTSRALGLPASVAAVLVLGLVAGLVRVLLAESRAAVDGGG